MPRPPRSQARHQRRVPPPFEDRDDYLQAVAGAVREQVQALGARVDDPPDTDEFEYLPPHLRARRRGPRGAPPGWSPAPGPRADHAAMLEGCSPQQLRARVAATRTQDSSFVWPHQQLARATGLRRHLTAALVVIRSLEIDRLGPDLPPQTLDPDLVAELTGSLYGTRRAPRSEIARALRPDGLLVRGGLVLPGQDRDHGPYRGSPSWLLPKAVRRFIDGRPTPLQETRLLVAGGETPEDWISEASAARIVARASGLTRARRLLSGPSLPTATLRGGLGAVEITLPEGVPAEGLAGALATLLDRQVVDALPRPREAAPSYTEMVAEARLHDAVLLVEAPPPTEDGPFAGRHRHPLFDDDAEPPDGWPTEILLVKLGRGSDPGNGIRLEPPGASIRAELWQRSLAALQLPMPDRDVVDRLARLPLHPEQIVEAAARHVISADGQGLDPAALLQTAGRGTRQQPGLEVPATRLDDVVLSPGLRAEATDAVSACRTWKRLSRTLQGTPHAGYGRTPVLLFSGPPGTGKTMLAEALAGELARRLRRLSGPDLRSCWYGEAEQRIRTEFRRDDTSVLFLDEVDGFLHARGDGPASRTDDRLANVLLEEIERTEHVVVMASNLPTCLDPALARRVLFHLRFEPPLRAEREAIWRLHLPASVAGSDAVDCARLARLELSGGGIKNASWRAILTADRDGLPLTTTAVEAEARREANGGGKSRTRAGFGGGAG